MSAFPTIRPKAVGDDLVQTVNARDLHAFLEIGRDFTTWIRARLTKYGLVEGRDYVVAPIFDSPDRGNQTGRGGDRKSLDFHLTLGTAKELAMVENNDQGRAVRRYFIECERRLHAGPSHGPALHPAAGESIGVRLRLVEHCRKAYGALAAQRLWFALDLPVVPEMRRPPVQGEIPLHWPDQPAGNA